MRLAGVDHRPALLTEQRDQCGRGGDDGLEASHIVAEGVAEAATLDKVSLHVDDDEGRVSRVERIGIGLRRNLDHQCPAMCWPMVLRSVSSIRDT